jgi:PAS domain S-box-containing protein
MQSKQTLLHELQGTVIVQPLLLRQLRKHLGANAIISPELETFLKAVQQAYEGFENDRLLSERSLDISSNELYQANQELLRNREMLEQRVARRTQELKQSNERLEEEIEFRTQAQQALLQSEQSLRHLIDSMRDYAIITIDTEGCITSWSGGAEQIFEYSASEILGQHVSVLYPQNSNNGKPSVPEYMQQAKEAGSFRIQGWRIGKNDHLIWAESSFYPLYDMNNHITGYSKIVRDISEQRRNEELLREANERFTQAIEGTNDGIWDWDMRGNSIYFSNSWMKILGFAEDPLPQEFASWQQRVHPEDLDMVWTNVQEHLAGKTPIMENQHRLLHKNGQYIWTEHKAKCLRDIDGVPYRLVGVMSDVTTKIQIAEELKNARDAAIKANNAKSAFLSSMSHELRTPLNAIIGFAQLLRKDPNIPVQEQEYVEMMYRSGNHLLDMINDILDISKIESGRIDILTENIDLHDMLNEIEMIFQHRAAEKKLEFNLNRFSVPRYVIMDAKRVKQILLNLLSNAIKFTHEGSVTLVVQCAIRNDGATDLIMTVQDTGRGIPEDQLQTIFEPFRQVSGLYSEGTGLGLAISAKLAQSMGGSLTVDSTFGKGSSFTFSVPVNPSALINGIADQFTGTVIGLQSQEPCNVLIVDDVESNRKVVRAMLESLGMMCTEALNGLQALECIHTHRPDFVLMDIMMPVMNGIEATQKIRYKLGEIDLPIIALTASGFDGRWSELQAAGFTEYIPKPFRDEEFYSAIERCTHIRFVRACILPATLSTNNQADNSELAEMNLLEFTAHEINNLPERLRFQISEAIEFQDFDAIHHFVLSVQSGKINGFDPHAVQILDNAVQTNSYKMLNAIAEHLQAH